MTVRSRLTQKLTLFSDCCRMPLPTNQICHRTCWINVRHSYVLGGRSYDKGQKIVNLSYQKVQCLDEHEMLRLQVTLCERKRNIEDKFRSILFRQTMVGALI